MQIICESVCKNCYLAYSLTSGTFIKRKLLKTRTCSHGPSLKNGGRKKVDMHTGCSDKIKESIRTMHQCEGSGFFGKGSPS